MTAEGDGDQRRRRTLRFVDPHLERLYQAEAAVGSRQFRTGPAIAAGLWLVGGLLAPDVTRSSPLPIYAIAAGLAIANLGALALASWATTLDRQQLVGVTLNVMAGIGVLTIASLTGGFDRFAAPGLMLISIFAFLVLRLQFVLASIVTAIYVTSYLGYGLASGSAGLSLNLFLVAATVIVACGGTYVIEDGQRRVFA